MYKPLVLILFALVLSIDCTPLPKYRNYKKTIPKDVRAGEYRLPNNTYPVHYQIDLTLEEDAFDTNTFRGVAAINLIAREETDFINIHTKNFVIDSLTLESELNPLVVVWSGPDSVTDIVTISVEGAELIPETDYVLRIEYTGTLSETDFSGFYESSYVQNGTVHYLATTDFEPTNARKAFPLYDEPEYKATFQISVTCARDLLTLTNTPVASSEDIEGTNLKKVTHEITPKISTYLIAVIVSEYTCSDTLLNGTLTQVCSRPQTAPERDVASLAGVHSLEAMKNFTDYDYADFQVGKLSQAAIPDFSAGAMENWGMVTYRETYLLWNSEEASNRYQQYVATVVAHELSHQWFGDLVTLSWWTDLFLNEGFATYFEYHALDEYLPEWELPKQFIVEQVQTALEADSSASSVPLSYYVEAPNEINNRFDSISYNKGGSVLNMVQNFLGLETFKMGLSNYTHTHEFSVTNPLDLWASFEAYAEGLPATVTEVLRSWTYEAGYPLITVVSDGNDITLSQERFLLTDTTSETKWYVPITYRTSRDTSESTRTDFWLRPTENVRVVGVLENTSWIVLNNNQIGYYRVNYDDVLRERIDTALQAPDFGGISVLNRAQIVDDLLNLARANKINYTAALNSITFLAQETEYYPWYPAFRGFNYLYRVLADADVIAALDTYISDLIDTLYLATPFDDSRSEDHVYTLKREVTLSWACSLGKESCVTTALEQFADYRDNDITPDRNLKRAVYCNGLRYSDDIARDYAFIVGKYYDTLDQTEQETILVALGCVPSLEVLNKFLETTLQDSTFTPETVRTAYSAIYTTSAVGVNAIFDFATANHQQFIKRFGNTELLNWVIYVVSDRFTTQEQLNKLTNFIGTYKTEDHVLLNAREALVNAQENLVQTKEVENKLRVFFAERK